MKSRHERENGGKKEACEPASSETELKELKNNWEEAQSTSILDILVFIPSLVLTSQMTLFGMRKYPTPVNKPMMPFYIGGVVMFFAINSLATSLMDSPDYVNDPRNPKVKAGKGTSKDH